MVLESALLCETPNGAAVRCACCGKVEVTLGNAVLCFDGAEATSVLEALDGFDVDRPARAGEPRRRFVLRLSRNEGAFVFDEDEVSELRTLLESVRTRFRPGPAFPAPRPRAAARLLH